MATMHSLEPGIYLLVDALDLPTETLTRDILDVDVVAQWISMIQGDELTACEVTPEQRLLCLYIALGYRAFLLPYPGVNPEDAQVFTDLIAKGALALDHHERAEEVLNEILMWMLDVLPEDVFSGECTTAVEDPPAPLPTPASNSTTPPRGRPVPAAIVAGMRMSMRHARTAGGSSTAIPTAPTTPPSTSNAGAPAALPTVYETPTAATAMSGAPTHSDAPAGASVTVSHVGTGGSLDGPAAPPALLPPSANLVATSVSPERAFSALALGSSPTGAVGGREVAVSEDGGWASDDSMPTLVTVADSSDSDGDSVVFITRFEGQT
ncbi:hypothetical protein LXA43DRAFT_1068100 [Ganoderma leucocontextum]|nr:hypothetical protein LXA43DRAFT_1068100 [Ganoderma leucocontextum]